MAVGAILIESIYKLRHPAPVSGEVISWVAGAGIVVNGLTAWLLMKEQGNDLNVKGAYLHMAMDTLVSVGVVISGVIISYTGWEWIDPVIGLIIAFIILLSTWSLLKESLFLTLDGVPENISMNEVETAISEIPGIVSWHHLHVWAVSTTENAATLHVVLNDLEHMEDVKHALKQALCERVFITVPSNANEKDVPAKKTVPVAAMKKRKNISDSCRDIFFNKHQLRPNKTFNTELTKELLGITAEAA